MNPDAKRVNSFLRQLTAVTEAPINKIAYRTGLALVALLAVSASALAQTAPPLGSNSTFGIVSSTFTNTAAGTTINGNVCFTTGPAFPATVTGTTGPCPAAAGADQTAALAILNGQACTPLPAGPLEAVVIGTNPAGTIPPGCYTRAGAIDITASGIVTLNGNGVYIFRSTGGAVTTGATSQVLLAGGACAGNVFWAPAGATTLGAASTFVGNILDAAGVAIGAGAALTGRALAFGGTVSTSSSTITVPGACAAPPPAPPTVTVTKVSNGGVGAFGFTGSNGFAPQTITTAAPGVGVSGATQTLTAAAVVTTITESAPPAGFTLASITCSGLGAGGTATPSIATRTVTLDAAATSTGAAIACTFTNTFAAPLPAPPTITVTKVSNGGVGAFSFTGSNGFGPQTITTAAPGVGVSGAPQALTAAAVVTTVTESVPPAGFTLASITCNGLGAGGTATPNIATRTVTLDAAATSTGAAIACTFTNTLAAPPPTVTVTKVSNGGVGAFGFTGSNGFGPQIITTAAPGVGVSGATQTLTVAAVATTVTESVPPAGFTLASITCNGLGAGGTATPNIATRTVTLDAAATSTGAAIACTFTNTLALAAIPIPTLSEWAMIMLAGMMAIAGFAALRRREDK